ncbi:MAG: L-seryl-tRNA(Sec) selenium transferase [Planctomycetes bacterium]|nr:L-seryl-tRNA(Sec) selenium transferase [Planctomycetota bacterium]
MNDKGALLRRLPNVGVLIESEALALERQAYGRDAVVESLRKCVDATRAAILAGDDSVEDSLNESSFLGEVRAELTRLTRQRQVPVINGTGVILHTSLGRAVIPPEAWEFASKVAKSYSMLELDQLSGKRGDRDTLVADLAVKLTGAEAATVVNNNAAATMLILNELANGKDAVISRAQMVEIGGSYRMMDVMRLSGASMVEVGATNKCKASDYEAAISDNCGCIIKVHTSNYAIEGFTHYASLEELVAIGRKHEVPVVFDLGAGSLVDLRPYGLHDEPVVPELIAQGADLVCFSGDKLLGGPQAGIVVGRADLIQRLKKNQMFRMLRCDKITLALLEETLRIYLDPDRAWERIPTLSKISEDEVTVHQRANRLAAACKPIPALRAKVVPHEAFIGGGSLPTQRIASFAIELEADGLTPDALAERLRLATPSVFGRIVNERFLLDARSISDNDLEDFEVALKEAFA